MDTREREGDEVIIGEYPIIISPSPQYLNRSRNSLMVSEEVRRSSEGVTAEVVQVVVPRCMTEESLSSDCQENPKPSDQHVAVCFLK